MTDTIGGRDALVEAKLTEQAQRSCQLVLAILANVVSAFGLVDNIRLIAHVHHYVVSCLFHHYSPSCVIFRV